MTFNPIRHLSGGDLYRPLPVFLDCETGAEIALPDVDRLVAGCTCEQRELSCNVSDTCICDDNSPKNAKGVCRDRLCESCRNGNAHGCAQYPGCECRRNTKRAEYYGCPESCHAERGGCDAHYDLRPQEQLASVQPSAGKGHGVFATQRIEFAQEIGVYSGQLYTRPEIEARDGAMRIHPVNALGVSAYLRALDDHHHPGQVLPRSRAIRTNAVAGYVSDGTKYVLAGRYGHKVLVWEKENRRTSTPFPVEGLTAGTGLHAAQSTTHHSFYTMDAGSLKGLVCCKDCSRVESGWDYRLYVDAGRLGNLTRYINHSCKPNLEVIWVRYGSLPGAFTLPLVVGDTRTGIPTGAELTISYWRVKLLPKQKRRHLKRRRDEANQQNEPDYCVCGDADCTGWTEAPPRAELLAVGVGGCLLEKVLA